MTKTADMIESDVTKEEVAAMWLYAKQYAESGLSAKDFYRRLSTSDKRQLQRMVDDIMGAMPHKERDRTP
jgi:hypothetical protein